MSNLQAQVTMSPNAFHVEGYEKIEYDLVYVDGVFAPYEGAKSVSELKEDLLADLEQALEGV